MKEYGKLCGGEIGDGFGGIGVEIAVLGFGRGGERGTEGFVGTGIGESGGSGGGGRRTVVEEGGGGERGSAVSDEEVEKGSSTDHSIHHSINEIRDYTPFLFTYLIFKF